MADTGPIPGDLRIDARADPPTELAMPTITLRRWSLLAARRVAAIEGNAPKAAREEAAQLLPQAARRTASVLERLASSGTARSGRMLPFTTGAKAKPSRLGDT